MTSAQLEHEIRLLKLYAAGLTVVVLVLAVSSGGTAQSQRQRFGEIDVERINVVDADGKLAFVLANRDRMPGPIMAGKELSPDLSQGRRGDAGMVFVGVRAYGLNVWDRPTKITLQETIAATAGITDRQAREARVRKLFEQRGENCTVGTARVCRQSGTNGFSAADGHGRKRSSPHDGGRE